MKKYILASLLVASAAAQAATTVIDFESTSTGSYPSLTLSGVTFSLSSGNVTVSNDSNGVYALSAPGTNFLDNRSGGADMIFSMGTSTDYFGLQVGAANSAQTLTAYDSVGGFLGSVVVPDQVSTQPHPYSDFFSLSYSGISKVVLTGSNGDWVVVDNVTVGAVPEPEGLALMLAGLAVAGVVARRRRA